MTGLQLKKKKKTVWEQDIPERLRIYTRISQTLKETVVPNECVIE